MSPIAVLRREHEPVSFERLPFTFGEVLVVVLNRSRIPGDKPAGAGFIVLLRPGVKADDPVGWRHLIRDFSGQEMGLLGRFRWRAVWLERVEHFLRLLLQTPCRVEPKLVRYDSPADVPEVIVAIFDVVACGDPLCPQLVRYVVAFEPTA